MKQGQATHSGMGSTKVEPKSQAINPGAADQIGQKLNRMAERTPMYEGRGLEAPMVSKTSHPSGSQGRHK